jgi:transketolase
MERDELINQMKTASKNMRRKAIQMTYDVGNTGAHIGGGLSLIEVMAVLYLGILKYDTKDMEKESRDRLIFSKGHGTLALYTAMAEAGIIKEEALKSYKKDDSFLSAHPSMNSALGIDFSSGSLGHGLSQGVGCALGLKRKANYVSKVYVILGDGECDEGSVWEAAAAASHYKLDNLVAIVDNNQLQYDGTTEDIMSMSPFEKKWESFGWKTAVVDGHNVEALYDVMKYKQDCPYVIIANTVKGKGVSFMENNPLWHNGKLTEKQYEQAMQEVME